MNECCEEYADGCVSCNLHETIRQDERRHIAALIAAEGPWCSACKSYEFSMSLARKGSRTETVYVLNPDALEVDPLLGVAYIHIIREEISTPIETVSVQCNLDIDSSGNVIGVEILEWPVKEEEE